MSNIKTVTVQLRGVTPYSQSFAHEEPKLHKESPDDYEKRTWRSKAHVDDNGIVCIPAMALKKAIELAAKRRADKIKSKGQQTIGARVVGGIIPTEAYFSLGIKVENVKAERVHADAQGRSGGGKRVWRYFPRIETGWMAVASFQITDNDIPADKLIEYIEDAGKIVGIGRWRAEKGGLFGRFIVEKATVTEG